MTELGLVNYDVVQITRRLNKTVGRVISDTKCPFGNILMNSVVRENLKVEIGGVVGYSSILVLII